MATTGAVPDPSNLLFTDPFRPFGSLQHGTAARAMLNGRDGFHDNFSQFLEFLSETVIVWICFDVDQSFFAQKK
jgi:hypothetical protein